MTNTIDFVLNGEELSLQVRPGEKLLEVLRERCGITSVKNGCSPQGQCGCCVALIDGLPKATCAVPAENAKGKDVLTLDGIPEVERRDIARAYAQSGALQCGFCTPGMLLSAKALLDQSPRPDETKVKEAISGNLCRCTGYHKIVDAVLDVSQGSKRGGGR